MANGKTTRGLRNNNPLNIRRSADVFIGEVQPSQDKEFKQFRTAAYGYRAAFKVLGTYINNYKSDTIRKIVSRWAPPEDGNDTESYIRAVSERSGIPADDPVHAGNREMMLRIVAAMGYVENGQEAVVADVTRGWELL